IAEENRALTTLLQAGLEDMGLRLASPSDPDQRGGSLMVTLPDHIQASGVVAALSEQQIYVDNRSQILRMSPGVLTTEAGIARTITALRELVN
ncbi:hypothetical protein Q5L94_13495, partial [Idiomarina sp. Sol25]